MKRVLHHYRAELWHDRRSMLCYTLLAVCWVLAALSIRNPSSEWTSIILPQICFVALFFWLTGLCILNGYRDSVKREEHFLRTRPVSIGKIYAAKSLHVLGLAIIPVLAQMVISLGLGFRFPLFSHFLVVLLWAQVSLYLGAFIRMTSSHAIKWCVSGLAVIAFLYLFHFVANKAGLHPAGHQAVIFLSVILSALLIFWCLAVNRIERPLRWQLLVTGVCLCVHNFSAVTREKDPSRGDVAAIESTLAERGGLDFKLIGLPDRLIKVTLDFQPTIEGSAKTLAIFPRDLRVANARGEELVIPRRDLQRFYGDPHNRNGSAVALSPFLDEQTIRFLGRHGMHSALLGQDTVSYTFELPESFAAPDEEVIVSFTPVAELSSWIDRGTLDYEKGATLKSESVFLTLLDSRLSTSGYYGLRQVNLGAHWASGDEGDLVLCYTGSSVGPAWLGSVRCPQSFGIPGHSGTKEWTHSYGNQKKAGERVDTYPNGTFFRVFQRKDIGLARLPRVSQTVRPQKLFGLAQQPARLPNYVVKSTLSGEQSSVPQLVNGDIESYLKALRGYSHSELQASPLIITTLNQLARESSATLLDYLASPTGTSRVSYFVVRSLTTHGPQTMKEKVEELVLHEPLLIDLAIKRGWADEVRESVQQMAPSLLQRSPHLVRDALIYYSDRESLDLLLEHQKRAFNLKIYEALLVSPEHREKAQALYTERKKQTLAKIDAMQSTQGFNQQNMTFWLRTGSVKVLRKMCEILEDRPGGIDGSHAYIFKQSLRWSDFSRVSYEAAEAKEIVRLLKTLSDDEIRYDSHRKRLILPKKKL